METKVCSKCRETKLITLFSKNCRTKDGYNFQCKSCISIRNKKRYERDKDLLLERGRHRQRLATERNRLKAPADIEFKKCTWCDCIKSIGSFNRNRTSKDGYESGCRVCRNAYRREKYYNDPEHFRAVANRHYHKHKEATLIRSKANQKRKDWTDKNNMYKTLFLDDHVVKQCLSVKPPKKVPKVLLETKREYLKIKRYLKGVSK